MTVLRIGQVSLTVTDTERLVRFYADAFGARVTDRRSIAGEASSRLLGVAGVVATETVLAIGDERVSLLEFDRRGMPYPADSRSHDLWFQHFALVAPDIERAAALAGEAGAAPIGAERPVALPASSGGVTAWKFRDPDGHPLELLQFPPDRAPRRWASRAGAAAGVLGIDHSAIAVADTGRSERFYVGLLGFDVGTRTVNTGPEQEALDGSFNAVVEVTGLEPRDGGGPHLELLCNRIPATGRPIPVTARADDVAATRLVLVVDDLDAAVDEAIEKTCRFASRHVVGQDDGTRAAMMSDPDGHFVVLRDRQSTFSQTGIGLAEGRARETG